MLSKAVLEVLMFSLSSAHKAGVTYLAVKDSTSSAVRLSAAALNHCLTIAGSCFIIPRYTPHARALSSWAPALAGKPT